MRTVMALAIGLSLFAGACIYNCPETPGVCPPQLECVNGFR
jgi:hypothetical protein